VLLYGERTQKQSLTLNLTLNLFFASGLAKHGALKLRLGWAVAGKRQQCGKYLTVRVWPITLVAACGQERSLVSKREEIL
jgi:hypothetical protein